MEEYLKTQIEHMMVKYYTTYYHEVLRLPDYAERVKNRLKEDDTYQGIIDKYKKLIPFFYEELDKQMVLVAGAGTGAECISFARMGYSVCAIEPDGQACEIIRKKCSLYGLPKEMVYQGVIEKLPFEDNKFDLIWSWTVLEHVQNVKLSIEEMYRVLAPGGWGFFVMPDYRQFYEGHYKLYLPMFLPKSILKIILKCKKRPTGFIDGGINYTNAKEIRNILQHLNFDIMHVVASWPDVWKENRTLGMTLVYLTAKYLGIQRDQVWIVRKQ